MKKNKRRLNSVIVLALTVALSATIVGCSGKDSKSSNLDPENPVTVTVWNYYNGDQLVAFEKLAEEFNASEGADKGIVVTSVSQGDIDTLADALLDSVNGKAGSQDTPSLAAVYSETAYILDQSDMLASYDDYFTEDELAAYIPGFIEEGRFNQDNSLLQFPLFKSTEIFTANQTDWQAFADATGITLDSLNTKEDLTAAAKAYYEWTDAQTPDIANDGKALYGRDSVANYIYLGSYELGHDLFKVNKGQLTIDMDRDTFKTLWDNYYIPYINGYFGKYAKFSSEDAKTGMILALTSSSSSVTYLPSAVTESDDSTHDIQMYETKDLNFKDATVDAVVQQGASYCLLKTTDAQQEGAAEFLKWATNPDRNLDFALESGYSPVTIDANNVDTITKSYSGDTSSMTGKNVLDSLVISADAFQNSIAYATKPFNGSKDVRLLLQSALQDTAAADRATVLASLESGASLEDAVAPFTTDEYFDNWFDKLCDDVTAITNEHN